MQGLQGIQGVKGDKGEKGENGDTGEKGDWINEGKCEYQESIFADKEKTVFCSVVIGRSGSYFTDWEYADPQYFEVVPKEIKKTIYVAKK